MLNPPQFSNITQANCPVTAPRLQWVGAENHENYVHISSSTNFSIFFSPPPQFMQSFTSSLYFSCENYSANVYYKCAMQYVQLPFTIQAYVVFSPVWFISLQNVCTQADFGRTYLNVKPLSSINVHIKNNLQWKHK